MPELFLFLQSSPLAFTGTCAVLGLMVGSFLNVVIHRLPKMMELGWQQQCAELRGEEPAAAPTYNLIVPRSACPHCNHAIGAWENIPIVSYLLLRGKCKSCGAAISPRYPIIEAVSGLLCAYAAWHFGFGWAAAGALLLIWAGLAFNLSGTFTDLHSAVLGAAFGYLALWSVYWLFKLATGKEGMGYGDFKLLAALGAWLGWPMVLPIVLGSSVIGAVVGIGMKLSRSE